MSVGSDSDLNENEKDPYQQSMQEDEIVIFEEILKDVNNILNEFSNVTEFNFPVDTSHFDFDPNPINQSIFQLTHQFDRISIRIPTTKVLLMYLMTIPLVLHLTVCLYANQLIHQKTVRRENVQGHKSKNQKGMPKITLFYYRVKNHAEKGVLLTFQVMIEPYK